MRKTGISRPVEAAWNAMARCCRIRAKATVPIVCEHGLLSFFMRAVLREWRDPPFEGLIAFVASDSTYRNPGVLTQVDTVGWYDGPDLVLHEPG